MMLLAILNVIPLLCLLVNGFPDRATNTEGDYTWAQPSTLKEILDLLDRLDKSCIKTQVLWLVGKRIETYFYTKGLAKKNIEKNLDKVLQEIGKIRKHILKDSEDYGFYSDYNPPEDSAAEFVDVLAYWLPILHSELWFLHFQTAKECSEYEGGSWREQKFGKVNNTSLLHKWLTDKFFSSVPSVVKGFIPDDLHEESLGSDLAECTGIHMTGGGPLNYAQYGLLLISPTWHDSNLASAMLFLQEFCMQIKRKKFDKYINTSNCQDLNPLCESLSKNLASLNGIIHPLYHGRRTLKNPYSGKIMPELLQKYVHWLQITLPDIIVSLNKLSGEAINWTKDGLCNAGTPGPFKYGFVFNNKKWEDNINPDLPDVIARLTAPYSGSLTKLFEKINTLPEASSIMDILDLLGRLCQSSIKTQLSEKIEQKMEAYLKKDGFIWSNNQWNIEELVSLIPKLRNNLLNDPKDYGKYNDFEFSPSFIDEYADYLVVWFPILRSELWTQYFMTSDRVLRRLLLYALGMRSKMLAIYTKKEPSVFTKGTQAHPFNLNPTTFKSLKEPAHNA